MAFHRTFALLVLLLAACSSRGLDVVGLAPNTLGQDMVAYWSCDEASGGMLGDHSGNGYNGNIIGATWLQDSGHPGFGGALHFESGNSVVVGAFPDANDSWSVSLWVRPAAWASPAYGGDSYVTLISTEVPRVGGWELNVRLPELERTWRYHFAYPDPGDAGSIAYQWDEANGFDVDLWTHLVAVVDSSAMPMQILFYKNGVLSAQKTITSLILPGSNALYMGRWSGDGRYFVGDLDDIVIYRRALVQAEVSALYERPAPSNLR
ncbi:MAG TPA: LamG domain-containing protein [Polyangia bacterium]|jgi:hypothetical protein|nr:LamG domain-containing protein [Polyangia bacterium]